MKKGLMTAIVFLLALFALSGCQTNRMDTEGISIQQSALTTLAGGVNAAVSSTTNGGNGPGLSCDGNTGTRWESTQGTDPQWIYWDLGSAKPLTQIVIEWEVASASNYTIEGSSDAAAWTILATVVNSKAVDHLRITNSISGTFRYVKMNGTKRTTPYGYSIWEVYITTAAASSTPVTSPSSAAVSSSSSVVTSSSIVASSSAQGVTQAVISAGSASAYIGTQTAGLSFDNNTGTRWESPSSDPQWIVWDLGSSKVLNKIIIEWEVASANLYQIQGSADSANWVTLATVTNTSTVDHNKVTTPLSGTYRYVRMYGTKRNTPYGYSIWEVYIYVGTSGSSSSTVISSSSISSQVVSSSSSSSGTSTKSPKRGIAYDLANTADLSALSSFTTWWYNWGITPNSGVPANYYQTYGMEYVPMLWGGSTSAADISKIETFILAHPEVKYFMVMNEPNLGGQAYRTPSQAASDWLNYEKVASDLAAQGRTVKIVGPQMTWGNMAGYEDPVVWMDAFIAAYQAANGGRSPKIDYLAFHWYDYGLAAQLDRLTKYGKQLWVTEFANWHTGDGTAAIDTLAKQQAQMLDMVNTCETRSDVVRYGWFTGRWANDVHFTSIFTSTAGQLSGLGQTYSTAPYTH